MVFSNRGTKIKVCQIEWFSIFLDAGKAFRLNVQIPIGDQFGLDFVIIVLLGPKTSVYAI